MRFLTITKTPTPTMPCYVPWEEVHSSENVHSDENVSTSSATYPTIFKYIKNNNKKQLFSCIQDYFPPTLKKKINTFSPILCNSTGAQYLKTSPFSLYLKKHSSPVLCYFPVPENLINHILHFLKWIPSKPASLVWKWRECAYTMLLFAGFIWWFYQFFHLLYLQYLLALCKRSTFCLSLSFFGCAQSCWFTLHRWRAEKS